MTWLGCTRAIQEKLKTAWYLINGLKCTVQNILMSLNTLFEIHMKAKKQGEY